ncbi:neuronal acetylcholine receptor subunit alpha-3-like [Mercenaria mercenaria]|uniref:neuronal acetylcholine receptor subunit alpha-3-like n=1 Tax=Mercenaria mercenaria TaxID=6596 RepID=UPI00234F82FF|nr:neuronal acetylcholine receptor subunit alpha-3-like [Mercenaria mercenaria]
MELSKTDFVFFFTVLLTTFLCANGQTWSGYRTAYETIYNHYYNNGTSLTDIIPINNQSNPLAVQMGMTLNSLNGFDAVLGQIDISGSMKLKWTDEVIFTTYSLSVNQVDAVLIDYDKAWSPSLVLVNAVDTVKNIGDTTYKLLYNPTDGTVSWEPRVLLRGSCTPDVTYYPFDRQVCDFTYTAWGYMSEEIRLQIMTNEWDLSAYEENGIWTVITTTSEIFQDGGSDYIKFQITIQRQPLYFTFNVALPILLLGLLNGFVFLLPAESGERVGFCITCFLAFVVLMQTTMQFLPQIASPMSLLCVYVFLMMCFSVFINIVTVLMLRVYHKPEKEKVPKWMQTITRVIKCQICRCKDRDKPFEEVDWPSVARLLDTFFFIAFIAAQSALTFFFLLPLGTRY